MAAGIADHVWSMEEIAMLADAAYARKKRGPYKKWITKGATDATFWRRKETNVPYAT